MQERRKMQRVFYKSQFYFSISLYCSFETIFIGITYIQWQESLLTMVLMKYDA
jgi:hypothetical protein